MHILTCTRLPVLIVCVTGMVPRFTCSCVSLQNTMAQAVIDRVPSVEMVRFVNSGTEACLSVLRLMRAYTGREKVGRPCEPCRGCTLAGHCMLS